jgi:glycosyltransferase involved in cell wall biosynthesis
MDWPASVLIPLLRQEDAYLEQAVRSACTQTAVCEVVVAKSPRTPASNLTVLERLQAAFSQLVVADRGPAQGMAGALNAALRLARADRVGFLMSDDWLEPETVARCLPVERDIVSTGLTAYLSDGRTEFPQASVDLSPEAFAAQPSLHGKAAYLSHFYLLRKAKVQEVGGLDESLDVAAGCGVDDFDLIWTMLEHGASVGIVERRLYNYRDHPGQRLTLANRESSLEALRRILDKHGLEGRERLAAMIAHGFWQGKSLQEGIRQLAVLRRGKT